LGGLGPAKAVDLNAGEELSNLGGSGTTHLLALAPDGKHLAIGFEDRKRSPVLWSFAKGEPVSELKEVRGRPTQMAFSPDGRELAVALETTVYVYGLKDGAASLSSTIVCLNAAGANCLAYSPDGRLLAIGGIGSSGQKGAVIWDTQKQALHAGFYAKTKVDCYAVAFSPDGKTLAVGDQGVLLFDVPAVEKQKK
jgi:WD40 repeat protein